LQRRAISTLVQLDDLAVGPGRLEGLLGAHAERAKKGRIEIILFDKLLIVFRYLLMYICEFLHCLFPVEDKELRDKKGERKEGREGGREGRHRHTDRQQTYQ